MSNAIGRPSIYSTALSAEICARLVEGESLRSICRDEAMPGLRTVMTWLATKEDFQQQYTRAKESQADTLADDLLEIADDARNDWMERNADGESGWVANGENIQRSRLRVDTRKWIASRLNAKKYGDSTNLNAAGKIVVEIKSFSGDSSGETDGV